MLDAHREILTVSLWLAEEDGAGPGMIWGIVLHGQILKMKGEEYQSEGGIWFEVKLIGIPFEKHTSDTKPIPLWV